MKDFTDPPSLGGRVFYVLNTSNYIGLPYVTRKELGKIDKDVYRIAESKIGIEPELLDKPSIDDLD